MHTMFTNLAVTQFDIYMLQINTCGLGRLLGLALAVFSFSSCVQILSTGTDRLTNPENLPLSSEQFTLVAACKMVVGGNENNILMVN